VSVSLLKARVISGVLWIAATKASGQAITWIITIFVVRLLSPQDYGLMGMSILIAGFLLLFSELGLGAAIIQRSDLKDDQLTDIRWVIFVFNLALFVLLILLAPAVAAYFREPALTPIVRALSATFIINGVGTPSGFILQRDMAFRKKAEAEFAGNMVGAVTTVGMAAAGFAVWSLVIGYLLQQLVMNALYCVYAPFRIGWTFRTAAIREHVQFGSQVAFGRVLWYVASDADVVIVGRVLGAVQLGYYSLAFQFSSLPIEKIVTIVTQVAFPSFAAVQHDIETTRRHFLKLVNAVALTTFPMFIGLLLVADAAVGVFLTDKWLPVVLPLKLLSVVSCFRAVEAMNAPMILASGRPRIIVLNSLLQVVVLPIAFYVGAQYGLVGVALAWLIVRPVLFAIITWHTLTAIELPIVDYLAALKHATGASIFMAVIVTLLPTAGLFAAHPGLGLAATCLVGGMTYVAYHLAVNRGEVRELVSLIRFRRATVEAPTTSGVKLADEPTVVVSQS
jgi:teichuronic acid exporter